ncbi:MAG: glycosyltransferase family 1 protein [Bacteroidetes bacterium]|nr:glycosyltransferase family 1 protein [Bacteroidota bacterium]
MRLAIFTGEISAANGGVYTYILTLLKTASQIDEISRIYIVHGKNNHVNYSHISGYSDKFKLVEDGVSRSVFKKLLFKVCLAMTISDEMPNANPFRNITKLFNKINPYRRFFERLPVDVVHIPFGYIPMKGCSKPLLITMHDMQELKFPVFFTPAERLYRAFIHKIAVEKSKHIMVSFSHIQKDIVDFFGISANNISVCMLPFTTSGSESEVTGNQVAGTLEKYGIEKDFILYPASTWPHKNHKILIEAIQILQDRGFRIPLVCTGKKTKDFVHLEFLLNCSGLNGQIIFTDLIPENDLMNLYQLARLVVIPSLYEAGSAPLFEAMGFLTPVICSNTTSLPETINDSEFVFDPYDPVELSGKILLGFSDESFRNRNINNLRQRLNFYKSIDYAANLYQVYKQTQTDCRA